MNVVATTIYTESLNEVYNNHSSVLDLFTSKI